MGCDIHFHIEYKIDGQWVLMHQPRINRDYTLFGLLAGVREVNLAPYATRGLPDDISVGTRVSSEYWSEDGHSHSYIQGRVDVCGLVDALQHATVIDDPWGWESEVLNKCWFFGGLFSGFWSEEEQGSIPDSITDIRYVFWFNN